MTLHGHCHACGREVSAKYKAHRLPARMYCDNVCRYARVPMTDHGDGSCSHQSGDADHQFWRLRDGQWRGGRMGNRSCGLGHGTYWAYQDGCRCPMCTAACRSACMRQKIPRYVARAAGEEVPAPHGSVSAYTNHGCRCETCRAAHAGRCRAWRAARRRPYVATLVP